MVRADVDGLKAHLRDADRVEIRRADTLVASARWDGRTIVDCVPPLPVVDGALEALARQIEDEVTAAFEALPPPCDDQGVDLTLIDWMLGLTPTERLAVLQDAADAFDRFAPNGNAIP